MLFCAFLGTCYLNNKQKFYRTCTIAVKTNTTSGNQRYPTRHLRSVSGVKILNPDELSIAETFFEKWADSQKLMQLVFSDTYTVFNHTVCVRGTTNGNTFASDVTPNFYAAFPQQEKDMAEPLNKLGVPFFEYSGGPRQDLSDIANDITTAQLMLPITIDSVSVIAYNPDAKKWDPIITFPFKSKQ